MGQTHTGAGWTELARMTVATRGAKGILFPCECLDVAMLDRGNSLDVAMVVMSFGLGLEH